MAIFLLAVACSDDGGVGEGAVYVSGHESNGTNAVAKYWKNGGSVSLTDGARNAVATGMVVVP